MNGGQNTNIYRGFTLVETMVAISVLMFAVLGPLSIASSSLVNARIARDQITAFYLAQEGLEFVRYARDTNYLSNPDNVFTGADEDNWVSGLDACFASRGCMIDVEGYFESGSANPSRAVSACGSAGCDPLSISNATGRYTYAPSGDDRYSPFTRTVRIERVANTRGISNDNNEIKVTSRVTWSAGLVEKEVELTEYVSNIYDYE